MVDTAQQSHWVVDDVALPHAARWLHGLLSRRQVAARHLVILERGVAVAGTFRATELGSQASPESPSERVSTRLLRSPTTLFSTCSTAGSAQLSISTNQRLTAYV